MHRMTKPKSKSQPKSRILLFAWLIAAGVALPAMSLAATEDEVQALAEKFQETKKNIVETEVEKRRILGALYSITQRMKRISHEKNHLTDELFHVQDSVKGIAKLIVGLEGQIERQRRQLRRRLRALYKFSGEGYLGILFSQTSVMDVDEVLRFLKIVTENDYQLIRGYQENIAAYKEQRKKLKMQVEKLIAIERKIKKQEGLLAEEHKQKTQIVSELDRSRSVQLSSIRSIRDRTKTLKSAQAAQEDSVWRDLLKPSIFEQKGQLPGPVHGVVTRDFGLITDERYKIQLSHKGWRFSAPRGTPVSSIFDGTIAHSGFIKGYGHTVIIDHGDHYYSVYSHISRVKPRIGDTLKKGQVFAETGPADRRSGEGMYFELRHFSEPENPANWIATKNFQIARPAGSLNEPLYEKTYEKAYETSDIASAAASTEDRQRR